MEVSDTEYDSQGRTLLTNSAYTVAAAPSGSLFIAAQAAVPSSTVLTYDGAGREIESDCTPTAPRSGTPNSSTLRRRDYRDPAIGRRRPRRLTPTRPAARSRSSRPQADTGFSGMSYTYSYDSNGGTIMTAEDAAENWSFTDNRLGEQTYGTYPDAGTTIEGSNNLGSSPPSPTPPATRSPMPTTRPAVRRPSTTRLAEPARPARTSWPPGPTTPAAGRRRRDRGGSAASRADSTSAAAVPAPGLPGDDRRLRRVL